METKSLILAFVPILLAGLFVHGVNARIHRQTDGPRWWMIGTAVHALGVGLIAARGLVPDFIGIVVGDVLAAGGFYLMLHGVARFADRQLPRFLIPLMTGFMLIGFPLFTYVIDSGAIRFGVFAVAIIVPNLAMLPYLKIIGDRDGQSSVRLLRYTIWYFTLSLAAILGGVLIFDPGMPSILAGNNIVGVGFLSLMVVETNLVFGFVLLSAGHSAAVLREAAFTDVLTGLPNRRAFERVVSAAAAEGGEQAVPAALAVFDIDHFKRVNDRYGHDIGDAMLRHVAQTLAASLRADDFLARLGGEEFVALIHADDTETVAQVAERARRSVEEVPLLVEGKALHVTVSAGVVELTEGSPCFTDLFRAADAALYEAKDAGRNQIVMAAQVAA